MALQGKNFTACPFYRIGNYSICPSGFTERNMGCLEHNPDKSLSPHAPFGMTAPLHTHTHTRYYYTIYYVYRACLWSRVGKISQPILSDPYIFLVKNRLDQTMSLTRTSFSSHKVLQKGRNHTSFLFSGVCSVCFQPSS